MSVIEGVLFHTSVCEMQTTIWDNPSSSCFGILSELQFVAVAFPQCFHLYFCIVCFMCQRGVVRWCEGVG